MLEIIAFIMGLINNTTIQEQLKLIIAIDIILLVLVSTVILLVVGIYVLSISWWLLRMAWRYL